MQSGVWWAGGGGGLSTGAAWEWGFVYFGSNAHLIRKRSWTLSIASVKVNRKRRRRALSQTRRILEELRIRQ